MDALKAYLKIEPPAAADLKRVFGEAAKTEGQPMLRLEVDLKLDKPLRPFLSERDNQISSAFKAANVVSCDANVALKTMGVWVREEDADMAQALLSEQPWIKSIRPGQLYKIGASVHR